MDNFDLDIPMPVEFRRLLLDIVKTAKNNNTLSFQYFKGLNEVLIRIGPMELDISDTFRKCGDPIRPFEIMGLLVQDDVYIYLTPKAFRWYGYEKKNRISKWFTRLPSYIRDGMIGIAFILSLILTILQIADLIK